MAANLDVAELSPILLLLYDNFVKIQRIVRVVQGGRAQCAVVDNHIPMALEYARFVATRQRDVIK